MVRITQAEINAAKAMLPRILPTRLKPASKLLVGLCPIHNEKTPSFTVYPNDWHFFCFGCQAHGDAISFVQRTKGLAFADAVRELIGLAGPHSASGRPQGRGAPEHCSSSQHRTVGDPGILARVAALWVEATAPRLAQFYLESRGVHQNHLPTALRGHERVWCQETGEHRPAMLAAISDGAGRLVSIQKTYLERRLVYDGQTEFEKGARAAALSKPKVMTPGSMGNGAVKLAAAGEVLGIAEGVESALAAAKLYSLPVWAACGSGRLGNIELPEAVRHVVIFGDNDANEAGRKAAAKAEALYQRRGYSVQCEFPESDWAEQLLR